MKHIFTFFVLLLSVLMFGAVALGQGLLNENFSYTAGTLLTANGWSAHSSGGTNAIKVASSGLTYSNYYSSGVGLAAAVDTTGEDDNRTFTSQTSGSVYASCLVNFSKITTSGDYFFHLREAPSGPFYGRLFARKATNGNLTFGVCKNSTAFASIGWSDSTYSAGVTYLVVIKYKIIAGTTNDSTFMWINPILGGSEPVPQCIGPDVTATDPANIGAVCLRQGTAANAPRVTVDGIRVGTTWEYVTALAPSSSSDIVAAGNETSSINYASYQAASFTDSTSGVRVWSFDVRDGGSSSPDADLYPTILSSVTIGKGASNTVSSWANTIRQAALYNGPTKVAEVSVTGETISFSGLSGAGVTAPDDGSTRLSLYLTFKTTVTDNQQFQFQILSSNVTVPDFGSSTFMSFLPVLSTAPSNAIQVTATKLAFSTQPPATVAQNNAFSSAVEARDANENVDVDYATNFTLSVATGTGVLSSVSGLTKTPALGSASWSDLKYNTAETGVSILAQSGTLTSATSNTFEVKLVSVASDIVAGILTIPTEISSLVNTQGAEVAMFDFTVRDGGASADVDMFPTIINGLNIVPGASNNISDWSTYIQGAELYDDVTLLGTGTTSAASIAFSGSPLISVPDNGSKTLTLKIWLKNPLPAGADGKIFQAKINQNTNVTLDPAGSMMAGGGSDVVGGIGSEVSVVATALQFVGTIPNTRINTNFSASAKAVDANGNIDADFISAVTFSKASGPGNLTGTTAPLAVLGVATTTNLQFDVGGSYTLDASALGLTNPTSNPFLVESPALFRAAASVADTMWWDNSSSWVVDAGFSISGVPHSRDTVILDHKYRTGKYIMAVGPTYSDTAAQITVGYPGNPDTIILMIPYTSSGSIASLVYGDGVVGNYDLIIAEKGIVWDSKYSYNKSCLYRVAGDSVWIRTGGLWYHNTNGYNTMLKYMSRRMDGDYGTVEFDVPTVTGMTFDISGGSYYWYPNVVLSNTQNAPTYWYYGTGATYIKGNLTIKSGAKDSMMTTYPFVMYGDIINNGIQQATTSTVVFAGSTAQTVSGNSTTFGAGMVSVNGAGVNFLSDVNVTGGTVQTTGNYTFDTYTLPATGIINTGSSTMYLNPNGSMNEGSNPVIGNVSSTRTATQNNNMIFGNGVEINAAGGAPGVTTVLRKTGVASTGNGNQSIKRYFDITPANNVGLNATLGFSYSNSPTELNGLTEADLMLFKSADGGVNWSSKSGSLSTLLHKITATGINSFSRWTAGSKNLPLFITHTITVKKWQDMDGDIFTTGDQTAKKWKLYLYKDIVDPSTLVTSWNTPSGVMPVTGLEEGTYIAAEEDSTGWLHLGKIHNGSTSVSSSKYDTVAVSGGVSATLEFINQKVSSIRVLKFKDTDGDPNTTGDQTAKNWFLTVYKTSVDPGNIVAQNNTSDLYLVDLQAGKYIVVEADSGSSWVRINGNHTQSDTITITAGQDVVDQFINFRPNAITVRKFKDTDGKFGTTSDRVKKAWHLEVHKNTVGGLLVASGDADSLHVGNLGDGTYIVVEADSTGWIHIGYDLNGSPVTSSDNNVSIALANGQSATVDFVNAPPIYSQTFRSFHPDSIALAEDLAHKHKPIAKKAVACDFAFRLFAPSAPLSVKLKFSMNTTGSATYAYIPFLGHDTTLSWSGVKEITLPNVSIYDSSVIPPTVHPIQVVGRGDKGKAIKVTYQWLTTPRPMKVATVADTSYSQNTPRLPMPNRLNALSEVYLQGGFSSTNGMLVGLDKSLTVPDSSKFYGWLLAKKWGDADKSLIDRTIRNTAPAHGFDFYNGKALKGKQTSLSPTKYDNTLLANMIALKLNIVASAMTNNKTPVGFGELIYDDGSGNPLNGKMVKEIAAYADSVMMGFPVDTEKIVRKDTIHFKVRHFANAAVFAGIDSVVGKINNAFEGVLDTMKFSDSLQFKGAKALIAVSYMRANPSAIPARIVSLNNSSFELPSAYVLYQNYPNPFNPSTMIEFDLPEQAFVTLKIYNLLGQEVATLFDHQMMTDGAQQVQFDAYNLASGVYFYRIVAEGMNEDGLQSNTFSTVKKMMLLK